MKYTFSTKIMVVNEGINHVVEKSVLIIDGLI